MRIVIRYNEEQAQLMNAPILKVDVQGLACHCRKCGEKMALVILEAKDETMPIELWWFCSPCGLKTLLSSAMGTIY